ncbi:MAG: rRNA (cytosine967-C5)-methyltransferase [Solirubrobacteraceae bacterium]|jgi:16S rRNA (cytosine967-C5)-methyltransferase|nr:rRNA (cytosine967-C5)-methyltransferase [Solirubrobacteraceae bacterium]
MTQRGDRSPAGQVAPARLCAFTVVRRVFEQDAYADRALIAEAADLEPRDRALATALVFGTVQRRATLDYVAEVLTGRSVRRLQAPVLAALRLGLQQLLFMDGVAEHAAVNESVELAKTAGGRPGAGLVNAVLRRATREGRALVDDLPDETPEQAALRHSVPEWLAALWFEELGADTARLLLAHINAPAEAAVRANMLVTTPEQVMADLPVRSRPVAEIPEAIILEEPFDVHGSDLWRQGAIMPQARSSMLAGRALAPSPGMRVLDLCAAPGAKATQLAALRGGGEGMVAVERHPGRAQALTKTFARMHVTGAAVEVGDAAVLRGAGDTFDAVLVDPPCSGLGTLQSRPDLRWRTSPERVSELAGLQAAILKAAAPATAPDGILVYSVCTITRAEGDNVISAFLDDHPDFRPESLDALLPAAARGPYLRTLPHRDGTDGFFIARLRRAG